MFSAVSQLVRTPNTCLLAVSGALCGPVSLWDTCVYVCLFSLIVNRSMLQTIQVVTFPAAISPPLSVFSLPSSTIHIYLHTPYRSNISQTFLPKLLPYSYPTHSFQILEHSQSSMSMGSTSTGSKTADGKHPEKRHTVADVCSVARPTWLSGPNVYRLFLVFLPYTIQRTNCLHGVYVVLGIKPK